MSDAAKKLAEIVLGAIKAESDGQSFYAMAALSTQDEQAREVFERLAKEELSHKHFLIAQYRSLLDHGRPDLAVKLGKPSSLDGMSPIFSSAIKSRIKEAHIEMSALSIGMQLELAATRHYSQAAEASEDETVKTFFTDLSMWEQGHYEALQRQQEALREDYWESAGFSPF